MENASKALLISGGVLIGMLVISIGVYLFATYSGIGSSYEQTMQTTEIQKFNSNFTKFEGRTDITTYEIATLINFIKQHQEQTGEVIACHFSDTKFTLFCKKIIINYDNDSTIINLIEKYANNSRYEFVSIEYNPEGKVDSIRFDIIKLDT